ncbi:MAG: hypothetical protein GY730_11105 [bacterium]|nr:hypothetical protein [bacterium]
MLKIVALKEKELPVTSNKFSKIQFKFTDFTNIINSRIRKHNTTSSSTNKKNTDYVSINKSDLLNVVEINFEIFTLQELTTLSRLSSKFLKLLKERYEKFNNSVNLRYNRIFNDSNGPENNYRTEYRDFLSPKTVNYLKYIEQKLIGNRLRFLNDKIILEDIPRKILSCNNKAIKLQALKTITSITKHNKTSFFSKQWVLYRLGKQMSLEMTNQKNINNYSEEHLLATIEAISVTTGFKYGSYSQHISNYFLPGLTEVFKSSKNLKTQAITLLSISNILKRIMVRQPFFDGFSLNDLVNTVNDLRKLKAEYSAEQGKKAAEKYADMLIESSADIIRCKPVIQISIVESIITSLIPHALCEKTFAKKNIIAVSRLIEKIIKTQNNWRPGNEITQYLIKSIGKLSDLKEAFSTISALNILSNNQETVDLYKKSTLVEDLVNLEAVPDYQGNRKVQTYISALLEKLIPEDEIKELISSINIDAADNFSEQNISTISKCRYLITEHPERFNSICSTQVIRSLIYTAVNFPDTKLKIVSMDLITELLDTIADKKKCSTFQILTAEYPAADLISLCKDINNTSIKVRTRALSWIKKYINTNSKLSRHYDSSSYISQNEFTRLAKSIPSNNQYSPVLSIEKELFLEFIDLLLKQAMILEFNNTVKCFASKEGLDLIYSQFITASSSYEKLCVSVISTGIFTSYNIKDECLKSFRKKRLLKLVAATVIKNGMTEGEYAKGFCALTYNLTENHRPDTLAFNNKGTVSFLNTINDYLDCAQNLEYKTYLLYIIKNIMEDNIDGQKILIENNILDLVFELCTELTQLDIESLSQEYTLDSVLSILYTTSKHPDLLNDALNLMMKGSLITTLKHIASLEMKTSDHLRLASFMSEVIKKNRFTGRTLSRNTKVFQWATALITKLNINSPYKLLPAFKIMEEFTKHIKDLKKDERKDLTKMIDSSRLLIKMTDIANIACPVKKKEAGKELYEAFIETVSNLIDMNAHISLNRDTSKKMLKLIKTIHGFEEFNRRKYIEHLTKIVEKFPCVDKNTINMLLDLGAEADTRNKVACVTGAVNCCISTTSYIDGKKIKYALVNMGKVEELDKDTKIDIIKLMINISKVEKLDENTKIDIINILIQFMIQDNLYYIFVEDDIDI